MIRIVTDSMSDLTQEDARRLDVEVFPMPVRFGEDEYWEMGDNRNHSEDSRFWQNKFVKKNKIVGKVEFRYYPKFSTID